MRVQRNNFFRSHNENTRTIKRTDNSVRFAGKAKVHKRLTLWKGCY